MGRWLVVAVACGIAFLVTPGVGAQSLWIAPYPAPTSAQLDSLRMLMGEIDGFMARGQRFRATVEHLADRQEARIDAGRRRWMVAGSLPTAPPSHADESRPRPSLRPHEALAAYVAALDQEPAADVPTTSAHLAALQGMATLLEQPAATLGDSPAVGCAPMLARLVDDPTFRPRRTDACIELRRMVDRAEVAAMLGETVATPMLGAWTARVPTEVRWRPELLAQMAMDAILRGDDETAVVLLRAFLWLYPTHADAPRATRALAEAWLRLGHDAQAAAREADLGDYALGTVWAEINAGDPVAVRSAEALGARGLRSAARAYLDLAARDREARDRSHTPGVAAAYEHEARWASDRAADTLRRVIALDPLSDENPELQRLYADALGAAGRDQEAAHAYSDLLENNMTPDFIWIAARGMIDAHERYIRTLVRQGTLAPCDAVRAGLAVESLTDDHGQPLTDAASVEACTHPPVDDQGAIHASPIPVSIRRLMAARVQFLQRVRAQDVPRPASDATVATGMTLRARLVLLNAQTELRYGAVDDAERDVREIARLYCDETDVRHEAIQDLRALYVLQHRRNDLIALARMAQDNCLRDIPFPPSPFDDGAFRAMEIFHLGEHSPANESVELYQHAGEELGDIVAHTPNHRDVPLAMFYEALAFERAGRPTLAARVYGNVRERYSALRDVHGVALSGRSLRERINIVEQATFRLAVTLEHALAFNEALAAYHDVATDPGSATAISHGSDRRDALRAAARINASLGRWAQATAAWSELAHDGDVDVDRADVDFHVAEIPYLAGHWADARRALRAFLHRVGATPETAHLRLVAAYEIAQACGHLGDYAGTHEAQREAAQIFGASGLPPASPDTWYVVHAGRHPGTAPEDYAGWGVMEGPVLPSPSLVGAH